MTRTIQSVLLSAVFLLQASYCFSAEPRHKELIVWISWQSQGLEAAVRQFEQEHPGWRVAMSLGTGAGGMDPQKLMCGIAGGSPPDTLTQDRFSVGEWAVRDAFMPLDDLIQKSIEQEKWAEAVQDALASGKTQAAAKPLQQLITSLQERGPSRQLTIANNIVAALAEGRPPAKLVTLSQELAALCQGIHPEKYYTACWEEASYGEGHNRRVYAIPNTTDDRVLFYNEDLLERAGLVDKNGKAKPPADWKELKQYAIKLTERDKNGDLIRLGFAPNFGNSWLYLYGWLNGGKFMTPDGKTCTLNDPQIVESLQFMVDIYDSLGGIEKVDAFQSTFQGGEFDPFISGKVAMKIDCNSFISDIANCAPNMRFRVVSPPAPEGRKSLTWSGGFSWAIPAGAKNADMAFELIRFLMTDRIWKMQYVVEAKSTASRGRSYVPLMAPMPHVNRMLYRLFVRDNSELSEQIREGFLLQADLMKDSRFRPVTPVGQLLWDEHVRAYEKAVRHTYTPAEALARGRARVQEQLDLVYQKKVYRKLNWSYPIAIVCLLVLGGAVFIYLRHGRKSLLHRMLRKESRAGYMFASPWLIGFTVLTAGPIIVSIIYSFCRYDVLHPAEFVGLDNYRQLLFDDPLFWKSLANTAFMMLAIPVGMAVGLAIAMLLNTKVRGMQIYRTIFYLPAIVPAVASSILWIWVLNPEMGLINSFLQMLGWADPPKWLQSASWLTGSKMALILMGLWSAGASMIIWLAGLKGIPQQLYEAAEIDGATAWCKFLHVTLPMLSPYIFFNMIMGVIGTMQIFTQAYIMTQGGPNDSTMFYAYYLFNIAFRYFQMGYASALAWILFVIILALTLIQLKLAPRWVHYQAE